ncbi:hypothetical protein D3C86_1760770 [compost metagenome]
MIRERQRDGTDRLAFLVSLARDDQRVAALKHADGGADRFGAVADFGCTRGGSHNFRADHLGHFRARIVVRDDHHVGKPRGDLAHDRPLALVAVAAAAEDHDHPARRERPH